MNASRTNSTVAAVVVTFNRKHLLCQCLDGILAQSRPVDALFVIDNASTDGTAAMISERYADRVRYVRMETNIGGAGGFHHGMKLAYDKGFEYIWIMDDDVSPQFDCLKGLLTGSSTTCIVAPLHISLEGKIDSLNAVRGTRAVSVKAFVESLETIPVSIDLKDITFEGPLIPRSVISAIGLPRSDFFIFWDDNEYGMRAVASGLGPLLCITSARMTRLLGRSATSERNWRRYYNWRNGLHVMRAYEKSPWKRWELDTRFILAYFKGLCLRRPEVGPFKMRLEAWIDSYSNPLQNRYLPPVPRG